MDSITFTKTALPEWLLAFWKEISDTAHHDIVEYWDGGSIKVFRGMVTMSFDDPGRKPVKSTMTHFFYMDRRDLFKASKWYGAVGPIAV